VTKVKKVKTLTNKDHKVSKVTNQALLIRVLKVSKVLKVTKVKKVKTLMNKDHKVE
jgi:hypothetical protein